MASGHGNGNGSHDDEAADEWPMWKRWAEMFSTLYRCQSLAKVLEEFCDTKAVHSGTDPLPGLGIHITDIGYMAEMIKLELDKALSQIEDLKDDYANAETDEVEEPL
jgi:hypothetical protein